MASTTKVEHQHSKRLNTESRLVPKTNVDYQVEEEEPNTILDTNPAYPSLPEDDFSLREVNPSIDSEDSDEPRSSKNGNVDSASSTASLRVKTHEKLKVDCVQCTVTNNNNSNNNKTNIDLEKLSTKVSANHTVLRIRKPQKTLLVKKADSNLSLNTEKSVESVTRTTTIPKTMELVSSLTDDDQKFASNTNSNEKSLH